MKTDFINNICFLHSKQMGRLRNNLILIWLSCCIQSDAYSISTSNCPCSKEKWEEREHQFNCKEKKYTCILNKDGELVETCIFNYFFGSDEVGCPFVDQIMPERGALIGVQHTWCNMTGCPLRGHGLYHISEMYKYPVCWIPEKDRQAMYKDYLSDMNQMCVDKDVESTTTMQEKKNENTKDGASVPVLVAVVILILVAALLAAIFIYFRRRQHRPRKDLESGVNTQVYSNYAIGLAWSHYTGYLKTLLPALGTAIRNSNTYKANPDRTSFTWVMLCPRSAKSTTFTEAHSITLEETIQIPETYFKVNMYKIKTEENKEPWYCCMEFPSALMSLGNPSDILSPEKVSLEVERFSYYIMNILNHEGNEECNGKAVALFYDDTRKSVKDEVALKVLKRNKVQEGNDVSICILKTRELDRTMEKKYYELERSLSTIEDTLTANLQHDDQRIVIKALTKANWIVMFGVNKAIPSKHPWITAVLAQLVQEGKCKIMCLFHGEAEENTTKYFPSTFAIDLTKETYTTTLVKRIVEGLPVLTSSDIALGDISFGLAWSFYFNYLQHVIPDLHQRLEAAVASEIDKQHLNKDFVRVSNFLWEIVPTSCTFQTLSEFDKRISGPINVEALQKDIHQTKRVYPARLYCFKVRSTTHFFLGEVYSPCKVLKAMKESSLVPLSEKQYNHIRDRMIEQMKSVLAAFENRFSDRVKTKIVEFKDGGAHSLTDLMHGLIAEEESPEENEGAAEETINLVGIQTNGNVSNIHIQNGDVKC